MRVIIAGTRDYQDKIEFYSIMDYIRSTFPVFQTDPIREIVSGHAKGVDRLGEEYANKYQIPLVHFLPNWEQDGKKAGPIRNRHMAEYTSQIPNGTLIAFWDDKSKGTKAMITYAKKKKLNCFIYHYQTRRLEIL